MVARHATSVYGKAHTCTHRRHYILRHLTFPVHRCLILSSQAGGTRLTITGAGFSTDLINGNNQVFIGESGEFECHVIPELCSPRTIVCETSPKLDRVSTGRLPLRVVVDVLHSITRPSSYYYTSGSTPYLSRANEDETALRVGEALTIGGSLRLPYETRTQDFKVVGLRRQLQGHPDTPLVNADEFSIQDANGPDALSQPLGLVLKPVPGTSFTLAPNGNASVHWESEAARTLRRSFVLLSTAERLELRLPSELGGL